MAQSPGIVYSTTIPYSGPPIYFGFGPPIVSLVVTDASGNSYIAGLVASTGLPTTPGVVQPEFAGGACPTAVAPSQLCDDAFIAKFDSKGALVFLTYLGGTGNDVPYGLAVDASGDIYIGGVTTSTDFPLAGTPWRPTLSNAGSFVTKLSGDGKTLIWSTVLNASLIQMAIAPDGSLYYIAQTSVAVPEGESITFALTKLTRDGQFVATANLPLQPAELAVGADGSVYVGGSTGSGAGFAAKMNPSLSGFAWQTLLGANGMDLGSTGVGLMQTAADGTLWVTGVTFDSDFPILPGALQSQPSPGGIPSGFLVHLSADGSKALAATYLPAAPASLALDAAGNVIFSAVGSNGFQATPGSEWPCQQSNFDGTGFFGKIDAAGQHLLWGTWTGPSVPAGPAAADKNGNAVVAGSGAYSGIITLTAMTTVPGPPRLLESCIVHAAFPYVSGPLAPGEILSIYGAGFGPQQGVGAKPLGNAFGTELAGVQVLIENKPVPLLYVSSAQINLIAPYLLDGRIAAHIKIVTADSTSNEVVFGVRQAAPEIFEIPSNNPDLPPSAAIINPDGTVNSLAHPAHVGDSVAMFVSGVGQTNPPGVDGAIPTAAGGTPVLPIMVQLVPSTSAFANVTYAGNAPGLVSGVTQVNFQIPQLQRTGAGPPYEASLDLYVGTASTGLGTSIWFE